MGYRYRIISITFISACRGSRFEIQLSVEETIRDRRRFLDKFSLFAAGWRILFHRDNVNQRFRCIARTLLVNGESIYHRVLRINGDQSSGIYISDDSLERAVSSSARFKVETFTTLWGNYRGILQVSLRLHRTSSSSSSFSRGRR